jgi:folate-binding protein YgfZ
MKNSFILTHGASINVPWGLLKIRGSDAAKFLQGQTTNDILNLPQRRLSYNALVDQSAKLQSFFLNVKNTSEIILFLELAIIQETKERLEKFVITEDVEISVESKSIQIELGYKSYAKAKNLEDSTYGFFWGIPGSIKVDEKPSSLKNISQDELANLVIESGIPRLGKEIDLGRIINETFLESVGISYSKGCFLGQETVSKIHHFRGPAYFPMKIQSTHKIEVGPLFKDGRKIGEVKTVLATDNTFSAYAYILRDFRLNESHLSVSQNNQEILIQLFTYSFDFEENKLSKEILELASNFFTHHDDIELAKNLLTWGIEINPHDGDLYESLGVLLGRQEKFMDAIELMDKLSALDPDSVMAYTNKSLYLMKLGKIEEAEQAKATATLKSFSYYGKIAKKKEDEERRAKQAIDQQEKRMGMFLQVLEIDPEDALANLGLGEIFFEKKEYQAAITSLSKVIAVDPKYSVAYLVLGKTYEALEQFQEAKVTYQKGIPIATAKGELMPANEMQTRLSKIKI